MSLAYNGDTVADLLAEKLLEMIVSQNTKSKSNGKKKT
jgi:hypothetical protein